MRTWNGLALILKINVDDEIGKLLECASSDSKIEMTLCRRYECGEEGLKQVFGGFMDKVVAVGSDMINGVNR